MSKLWKILTRKKVIDPAAVENSSLSRILNTFDLTALGVGSTLGVGVYVLAGHVAKDTAGPSVVLSFLIAAIASVFAGLCYAEFGARTPKAGSAYIYSYVCVGEFIAFVIGWNLILEYVIGSASVARGITLYLDMMINNTLQNTFHAIAPIDIPYLSAYFDFFSFGISLLLAVALAFGLKESSLVNNIFTTINVLVVLFVIVFGSIKADPANWHYQPTNASNVTDVGKGGFFPFGVEGMIKGAATCFYGFVGFDCIATTGEEVRNPQKAIPISIILSLFIVFLAYFGTSTVVTLMVPYYLQNPDAPIPYAFDYIGWEWAKWIVSIGGVFGLCASLFGAMFPLPRIIYAMANDSLVFRFLGRVSPRFQTPVIGTLLAGLLTGLMSAIFDLKQLVNMMSIGTLLAYTIVAASVLLLRYSNEEVRLYMPVGSASDSDDSDNTYSDNRDGFQSDDQVHDENIPLSYGSESSSNVLVHIFNCGRNQNPTQISESIVAVEVFLYCVMCLLICLCAKFWKDNILNGETWAISLTSLTVLLTVLLMMSMATQPTSKKKLSFRVPWVPLIPALSILVNIYLMLMLDVNTWIRFGVWMVLGIAIYSYSHRPFEDAQIKKVNTIVHDTEKTNGHYFINNGFEDDRPKIEGDAPKKKKRAPSPPRKSEDKTNEIQQELQKLDRMLEDVLDEPMLKRSVSVDSVREESIVADVHRDDVISFVECKTFPQVSTNSPSDTPTTGISSDEDDEGSLSLPSLEMSSVQRKENEVSTYSPPATQDDKNDSSAMSPSLNTSVTPQLEDVGVVPPAPPLLPPQVHPSTDVNDSGMAASDFRKVVLEPAASREEKKSVDTPPAIRASLLGRVTLKPVVAREVAKPVEFEPDDDNLRVGSNQYKSFLENLEDKLKRMLVIPPFVGYDKNRVAPDVASRDTKKNENVIEDSIDTKEARAKLGLYVHSRISVLGNIEKVETLTSNDVNENKTIEENITKSDDSSKLAANEDLMAHRERMNSIFRSINLKSTESLKNPEISRDVKSLGHKIDDKTNHRLAMHNIFENIESRRKD